MQYIFIFFYFKRLFFNCCFKVRYADSNGLLNSNDGTSWGPEYRDSGLLAQVGVPFQISFKPQGTQWIVNFLFNIIQTL